MRKVLIQLKLLTTLYKTGSMPARLFSFSGLPSKASMPGHRARLENDVVGMGVETGSTHTDNENFD